ncbi:MAG: hypothetical protein C0631_01070 [Sedimenticola sp.]|nr:MAG: hypothetical protein C0631_01070 [Sedimenticola sp.]
MPSPPIPPMALPATPAPPVSALASSPLVVPGPRSSDAVLPPMLTPTLSLRLVIGSTVSGR